MKEILSLDESIIVVSEMRLLKSEGATSTHIMTDNLINGIRENGRRIIFFVICEHPEESSGIVQHYSKSVDKVVVLSSIFGFDLNKYERLIKILKGTISLREYREKINKLHQYCGKPALILSHAPSFEAVFFGNVLKEMFPSVPYYQYWSDPVAISSILPEKYSVKRIPYMWAEKHALVHADRIIYGTKTLMQFQKQMFPQFADKTTYIDISFSSPIEKNEETAVYSNRILYSGNYFSNLRNIVPLVKAVSQKPDVFLDIYGQGDCGISAENVSFHQRVSPNEMRQIEQKYSISVCLLNHSCIQIPGKIFYGMGEKTQILVIADGPYRRELVDYLKTYRRFTVCDNTVESISSALDLLINTEPDYSYVLEMYSPQKIAGDLLQGGIT